MDKEAAVKGKKRVGGGRYERRAIGCSYQTGLGMVDDSLGDRVQGAVEERTQTYHVYLRNYSLVDGSNKVLLHLHIAEYLDPLVFKLRCTSALRCKGLFARAP